MQGQGPTVTTQLGEARFHMQQLDPPFNLLTIRKSRRPPEVLGPQVKIHWSIESCTLKNLEESLGEWRRSQHGVFVLRLHSLDGIWSWSIGAGRDWKPFTPK
ncbi:uncharacterized protein LOC144819835 [Lissotriton helveticus]